jgi:hypothetical protein
MYLGPHTTPASLHMMRLRWRGSFATKPRAVNNLLSGLFVLTTSSFTDYLNASHREAFNIELLFALVFGVNIFLPPQLKIMYVYFTHNNSNNIYL